MTGEIAAGERNFCREPRWIRKLIDAINLCFLTSINVGSRRLIGALIAAFQSHFRFSNLVDAKIQIRFEAKIKGV